MDASLATTATQVLRIRHVITPNAVIGCNTFASWIFSNSFKSLHYCMQELQRVACNNCTWNHGITVTLEVATPTARSSSGRDFAR